MGKNFGKTLGKIAGVAAPFIPGVGGVIAGLGGSALAGGEAQGQADAYTGKIAGLGEEQARIYAQLLPQLLAQAGVRPDGSVDQNFNPYASLSDQLYGSDAAIESRAAGFYDPRALTGHLVADREATDRQYDNLVSARQADAIGRGFTQGDSATDSRTDAARRDQTSSNIAFRRDLMSNNLAQRRAYVQNQQAQRGDLQARGVMTKNDNLTRLATGSAQGALGTFGGLQGMYQGRADGIAAGQSALIGSLAGAGGLGKLDLGKTLGLTRLLRRKQSTSLGTTNAQAPSPVYDRPQ